MDSDEVDRVAAAILEQFGRETVLDASSEPGMSTHAVQCLLQAAVRQYALRIQNGEASAPCVEELSATEVVTVVSALLDAADLEVFELSMWRGLGTSHP